MKTLCEIYCTLLPNEKRDLNVYYDKVFLNSSRWKILQLVKEGCKSNSEALLYVYKDSSKNSALTLLKKKVKKDFLEIILKGEGGTKLKTPHKAKEIDVYKKIIQAKIIHGRNSSPFSFEMLKDIYAESKENQILEASLITLSGLVKISVIREDFTIVEQYFKLLEETIHELKIKSAVNYCFSYIGAINTTTTNKRIVLNEVFKEKYKFVKDNISKSKIDDSIIHFQLVRSIIALSERRFKEALEGYEKAFKLVEESVVFQTSRVYRSGIKMSISKAYIYLNQYEEAYRYGYDAFSEFNPKMLNSLLALEHIFHSKFLSKEYISALEILDKALIHKALSENAMRKARWLYYQSVLSYITGDRDLALKQLRANNEIHKDKTGWLLGFKLLEMMITIDNTDYYLATFQIERLNQVIHKNKHANVARVKIISQIIKAFLKYNCDFQETLNRVPAKFELLEKEEGEYYWDPLGFEMIRFEKWFKERA